MIGYLRTTTFLIDAVIVAAVWIGLVAAGRRYLTTVSSANISGEQLRASLQNSLSTIGILLPLVAGLTAYLVLTEATADLSWLVMATLILAITMFVLIWSNFALIKLSSTTGQITVTLPRDSAFIIASGIAYIGLALAILHAIIFLLIFSPVPHSSKEGNTGVGDDFGFSVKFASGQSCGPLAQKLFELVSNATGRVTSLEVFANLVRESRAPRLRIIGSADVAALGSKTKPTYGNNAGLALNRAYCVAGELQAALAEQSVYVDTTVTVRAPNEQTAATADRSVEIRLTR